MLVVRNAAWIDREYGREKWPAVLDRFEGLGETSLSRAVEAIERDELGADWLTYQGFYAGVTDTLLAACERFKPSLIVELGAGWGRNLFRLWLTGGPRQARYAALEVTEAGRTAALRIGSLEDDLRLEVLAFDLRHPEPVVKGERVLIFSVFGIAEVPKLPKTFVPFMRSAGAEVIGVHFEPMATPYVERHDYNRDFVERLSERSDLVEVTGVKRDAYAPNPANPASLITWRGL